MIDIITHGSPCQDFSVAGKGKGGEPGAGTRSSLMHTTVDLVAEIRPNYVIWENVKNVLSKAHLPAFEAYRQALDELGYNSYFKVLNAKHYGIPQNRERVFCISILKKIDFLEEHTWPEPFDNGVRLKHLLEDAVDEKYYLSETQTAKLVLQLKGTETLGVNPCITPDRIDKRQNGRRFKDDDDDDDDAFTITAQDRHGVGIAVKEATKQGYALAHEGDSINLEQPNSLTRRGRVGVGVGVAQTLTTGCAQGVVEPNEINLVGSLPGYEQNGRVYDVSGVSRCLSARDYKDPIKIAYPNECQMIGHIDYKGKDQLKRVYSEDGIAPTLSTMQGGMQGGMQEPKTMQNFRIRKLTPLECWRLMGFADEDFYKAKAAGISDSQLYKQAGNSIVVDVLYHIFKNMFAPGVKLNVISLFSGIGAFEKGLERAGVKVNLVNYCEIDKYASKSYSAIHGVPESLNLWDVTKIDPKKIIEENRE